MDNINFALRKLPIYFAPHMRIAGQIVAINPELFHVCIQDYCI